MALLPLVCMADLAHPFSTPKLWLLGVMAALSLALVWRVKASAPGWPLFAWLGALGVCSALAPHVSVEALVLAALPLPLAWAIAEGALPVEALWRALLCGSAVESALACLQLAGLDPFALLGWRAAQYASPRMRVYGSLGNPDFVAAWLCATLPIYWRPCGDRRMRALLWAGAVLQGAAIVATGSRVALVAIPVAMAVYLLHKRPVMKWAIPALAVVAFVAVTAPGRPLETVIRGRLYLAEVALSRASEAPLLGSGAGSFEPRFSERQAAWLRKAGGPQSANRFSGAVDHAHNDYVEFYVEYGAVGLAAFLAAVGALLVAGWKRCAWPGFLAAAASLLAIALVDFPFHRPAEWALLWIALAAAIVPEPADGGRSGRASV